MSRSQLTKSFGFSLQLAEMGRLLEVTSRGFALKSPEHSPFRCRRERVRRCWSSMEACAVVVVLLCLVSWMAGAEK